MKVKIIEKQSFSVIGKLGQGLSSESDKWIPSLWQTANYRFNDISSLAKLDDMGNIVGIWGLMSDINDKFERWGDQGKYLAGCEVIDNAVVPTGWTKWVIPSYKYAVIGCTTDTYKDNFSYMVNEYLPNNNYLIIGAVHELYNPKDMNGELFIYFPIQKI